MADLTPFQDGPIVKAIYEQYEKREAMEVSRTYLGASIIGDECSRKLWYGFRWARREKFDGRLLRLFQTGHLAEARFVADLRSIGCEIHDTQPGTSKQFGFQSLGGHMRGHMDGAGCKIPSGGQKWHVLEFKTHSAKSFTQVKKEGVQKAKPMHYDQMQWYMCKANMERALYVAVNKDTDELYAERIEFDPVRFAKIEAKGEMIIFAETPPQRMSEDPSFYQCKWCIHHPVCHGGQVPNVSCRTCVHSTPEREPLPSNPEGGRWSCRLHGPEIPSDFQRKGCPNHLPLPVLLTYAEPVDAGTGWIQYQRKDNGANFIVVDEVTSPPGGLPAYTTHEISAAADHRAIADPGIDALRKEHAAVITG